MDQNSRCGSVVCLPHITHAISVARAVMEHSPHVMLAGEGALRFALARGFEPRQQLTDERKTEWQKWCSDNQYTPSPSALFASLPAVASTASIASLPSSGGATTSTASVKPIAAPAPALQVTGFTRPTTESDHDTIGLIALDSGSNLSGGCSTSGKSYKWFGRVGDSPIIGAGLFVDNEVARQLSNDCLCVPKERKSADAVLWCCALAAAWWWWLGGWSEWHRFG
jgi:N4-(beta-N-acetylglucosaminyl)-L-asparaginase